MAVKTSISEAQFASILAGYRLGEFVRAQPIEGGTVQTNYVLHTTGGRYVFRCYENRTSESVRFECNLVQYLKQHDYPCPAPRKDRRGRHVGSIAGKPFVIFEFVEGQHLEDPSEAQQNQLIEKAAALQTLTRRYRPRGRRWRWNYSPALCAELARGAAEADGTVNAAKKLEWHARSLAALDLPRSLPKGICHCDFHFSNILFKDGEFAALLDFDDANYTYLTFDLACLMDPFVAGFDWDTWQQFEPGAQIVDLTASRRVVAEYMRHRPLLPVEKRHLFDVVKLLILFDCVWYFARGDHRDFFEKRKIDALDAYGREPFYDGLFS